MSLSEFLRSLRPSDLTTYARIRNAALEGFAANGYAGTSVRDVAKAAGVSPGLVQHHFRTKAGLRDAVNQYVVAVAAATFHDLVPARESGGDGADAGADLWAAMGDTVTAWVRDNVAAVRYVVRALIDQDAEAVRVFGALVEIARTRWLAPMTDNGALRSDVDQDWAAIHVVVFNLASVLFESAISRELSGSFFDPEQLRRWNTATTELYRRGLSR